MPLPKDTARFQAQRRSPDLDEEDHRYRHNDRRHGVHRNTQWAMVGVGFQGMDVRNLENRKQRQQDQAHHHRHREGPPPAEVSIAFWASGQQHYSSYLKNTHWFD